VILAGDIGGTNTRLAFVDGDPRLPVALEIYPSGEHASLEEIVRAFLDAHPAELAAACFGVAGPVRDGHVRVTNLAWPVDAASVAAALGLERVLLLNDLEANAWGIAALGPDDFHVLNEGRVDARGNAAVCSAGTGLGEAGLYWDGERHHAFACEGGHTDFAPLSDAQEGLREFLVREHGHVSYERVCSGIGLVNIYRYLAGGCALDAAEISRLALAGTDATAVAALDLMVEIYGAEAGNLALKLMATGGVYLGGGIPPRILPKLEAGSFMRAFTDKGRFVDLLGGVPVRVILNDRTALMGAALHAAASLETVPAGRR
jgi:glucokinase